MKSSIWIYHDLENSVYVCCQVFCSKLYVKSNKRYFVIFEGFFGLEGIRGGWEGLNPQQVKIPLNPFQSLTIPLWRGLTEQALSGEFYVATLIQCLYLFNYSATWTGRKFWYLWLFVGVYVATTWSENVIFVFVN